VVDTLPSPIATLFPGYFALVMATGIVAIAAQQQAESQARTASGALAELASAADAIKPAAALESVQGGDSATTRARLELALARAHEVLRS